MSRVNEAAMRKWVKALRSGKYKQARGALGRVDTEGNATYCCLGVACDVFGKAERFERRVNQHGSRIVFGGADLTLPEAVQDWLGLSSDNPLVRAGRPNGQQSLAELNDVKKFTFEQIAEVIEQTWLGAGDR